MEKEIGHRLKRSVAERGLEDINDDEGDEELIHLKDADNWSMFQVIHEQISEDAEQIFSSSEPEYDRDDVFGKSSIKDELL